MGVYIIRCRLLTFPVDLTPFQMQKKQMTHTASRHRARSHFRGPMSSIPVEMVRTLRLETIHTHTHTHTGQCCCILAYPSMYACGVHVLSRNTHSQNSVTGEVKLVALAASHRLWFLRTVSSTQCSVFQGCLHLAQGSSG